MAQNQKTISSLVGLTFHIGAENINDILSKIIAVAVVQLLPAVSLLVQPCTGTSTCVHTNKKYCWPVVHSYLALQCSGCHRSNAHKFTIDHPTISNVVEMLYASTESSPLIQQAEAYQPSIFDANCRRPFDIDQYVREVTYEEK